MSGWSSWGSIISSSQSVLVAWPPSLVIANATSFDTDTTQSQYPWLSLQFRTLILGTTIPAAIVLLIFTYDFLSAVDLPKTIRKLLWILASPFTNFLSLDDLEDEPGSAYNPPLWKVRTMAVLSAIQAVAWAAFFCYAELVDDVDAGQKVEAGVGFVSWVGCLSRFLWGGRMNAPNSLTHC